MLTPQIINIHHCFYKANIAKVNLVGKKKPKNYSLSIYYIVVGECRNLGLMNLGLIQPIESNRFQKMLD